MSKLIYNSASSVLLFTLSGLLNYKLTQAETAPLLANKINRDFKNIFLCELCVSVVKNKF